MRGAIVDLTRNAAPAPGAPALAAFDPQVERYFTALAERGDAGRSELLSCAQQSSSHQLQLVNFLLQPYLNSAIEMLDQGFATRDDD